MSQAAARSESLRRAVPFCSDDLLAGFLVFLIALPLCLGISVASGFPATAGVLTAIIGGLVCPWIGDSELTIKGPAAALIVIAAAAVIELGSAGAAQSLTEMSPEQRTVGYRLAVATGLAAGLLQIGFAVLRLGRLGEIFPKSVVQGLLASVGIVIFTKQIYVVLSASGTSGSILHQIADLPRTFLHPAAAGVNPVIALIGGLGLLIMFVWPVLKHAHLRLVPAPVVVLLITVPLGMWLRLGQAHDYAFAGREFHVDDSYLIKLPTNSFGNIGRPDFAALFQWAGWKYALMFAVVGGLSTLVTAKAIDQLDPWRRKTSLDRDLLAVGIGSVCAGFLGGLPMISEIVRSRANVANGARTRRANAFHGLFLLVCVSLVPHLLERIPLAALGAMLVHTGVQLVSARGLFNAYRLGRDQFLIVVSTALVGVASNLLYALVAGIGMKLFCHLCRGVSLRALFRSEFETQRQGERDVRLTVRGAAVFSNWLSLKRCLEECGPQSNVMIDLSETRLVDHTVMEKLQSMNDEFERAGGTLSIVGLDEHRPMPNHPSAARVKRASRHERPSEQERAMK